MLYSATEKKWTGQSGTILLSATLSILMGCLVCVSDVESKVVEKTTTTTTTSVTKNAEPVKVAVDESPNGELLRSFLISRKTAVTDLIESKALADADKPSFRTQLGSIQNKIDTKRGQGELRTEHAFEIANELDDLIVRIGKESGKDIIPNRITVDTINNGAVSVSDSIASPVEIMALSPKELKMVLTERERSLASFVEAQGIENPGISKYKVELDRIAKMRVYLASRKLTGDKVTIPVAIKHDHLGKQVLGLVKAYEFLPVVGIYHTPGTDRT